MTSLPQYPDRLQVEGKAGLFLAVGNCTLDDVVSPAGKIACGQPGGNAVYAAAGMRLWGENVSLVSVVGADYPAEWLEQLRQAGIDLSAVTRIDEPHLLRVRSFYFADGRRTERIDEAHEILPPHAGKIIDLESEYAETGSPLHRRIWPTFCPDLSRWQEIAKGASFAHLAPGPLQCSRANAALLKKFRGERVVISFDWPWWDWDQEAQVDFGLLANIDFLLPSIEELAIHAGATLRDTSADSKPHKRIFEAARLLLEYGPRAVGVKMGARGMRMLLRGEDKWRRIPSCPTCVVDPTGAGDAFCGGFLVGLARTNDPVQASLYGAVSASFVIEEFGVMHALHVDNSLAQERLQQLQMLFERNISDA